MTRYKTTQDGTFPFTTEEEAEWDAREAEWAAGEADRKAAEVREQRNSLLQETDWRITFEVEKASVDGLGLQVPTVRSTYRQALRDITAQPGFPHNVTWPTEPST